MLQPMQPIHNLLANCLIFSFSSMYNNFLTTVNQFFVLDQTGLLCSDGMMDGRCQGEIRDCFYSFTFCSQTIKKNKSVEALS